VTCRLLTRRGYGSYVALLFKREAGQEEIVGVYPWKGCSLLFREREGQILGRIQRLAQDGATARPIALLNG